MRIIICGASGMIGSALTKELSNHALILVGRKPGKLSNLWPKYDCISWEALNARVIKSSDVIINLSGENIGSHRWSHRRKESIVRSRVATTEKISSICRLLGKNAPRILNASAIGIYGLHHQGSSKLGQAITEQAPIPENPTDFLSKVGSEWEAALTDAEDAGVNVVRLRFAVVLDRHQGAIAKMLPAYRYGFGAILGHGNQAFSWVCLSDVVRAITFILEKPSLSGAVNIVADDVISQRVFANKLARHLSKPRFLRIPSWAVMAIFGQMGEELLLKGQNIKGDRLRDAGFCYTYDDLDNALESLFSIN